MNQKEIFEKQHESFPEGKKRRDIDTSEPLRNNDNSKLDKIMDEIIEDNLQALENLTK